MVAGKPPQIWFFFAFSSNFVMPEKREDVMAKKKTTKTAAKKKAAKTTRSEEKKKKTTAAKKAAAQKNNAAKKTVATKTKKKTSVTKKKVTLKELLTKQFEKPDNITVEPAPKKIAANKIKDAPPFVDVSDPKERDRIRALLLKKIDLKSVPSAKDFPEERKPKPVPPKPKPVPPKPKPVIPVSELLKKTFTPWTKQTVVPSPISAPSVIPDAPPFVEGTEDEVIRIRELLFRKIDLTDIPTQPITKASESDEIPPKNVEPETTPETKKEDPIPENKSEKTVGKEETISIEEQHPSEEQPKPEEKATEEMSLPIEESNIDNTIIQTIEEKEPIMSNSIKLVFAGIAILFIMLYVASVKNHDKYFLIDGKSGVELWQGDFSPMGKSQILSLMGMELPENIQLSYTQSEVYPLICGFFLDQANDLLSEDNIPNLVQVKEYLEQAYNYADETNQKEIIKRLNGIDFMMFVLKADLAMQKGSSEDIEKAKFFIEEAQTLAEKNYQKDMIKKRLQLLNSIQETKKDSASKESPKKETDTPEKTDDKPEKLPETIAKPETQH
ncbi:hypothetical protein MHK_005799 [Candidatus Magnetomorum sp. HK-1]|nr:hypothetical protein MHK_005799 [Candidatus Magnetomorum sp. HK-1]